MREGWGIRNIEECINQVKYPNKVPKKSFLEEGQFPIISQEQEYINGYWSNEEDLLRLEKPVVIFGDHTKVLKFIDFDFVLGADGVKVLQPKDFLDPKFFYYFLNAFPVKALGYARHYRLLKEMEVQFPRSLPEQQKIASILTSVDTVIEKTKAQINKLKDLKKAMMQELLTKGICRSSGMSENIKYWDDLIHNPPDCWGNSTLGNLFDQRKEKQFDHLPLLAVTGGGGVVPRDTLDRRDTSNADKGKYLKVEKGDIVYNTMRMWQGVSGISDYLGIVSPAYTVCKPKSAINSSFAKYLFKLPHLVQVFHRRAQGLVDDTLNLKYESFSKIKVVLPPLPEQQKIASILTSIDTNIDKNQNKLSHTKSLKKALMQDLLTGKVRVAV